MAQDQIKLFPCSKKQTRKGDKKIEQVFNCKLNDDGDKFTAMNAFNIFFIFFAFVVTFLLFIGCHLVCKLRGAETSSLNPKSTRRNRTEWIGLTESAELQMCQTEDIKVMNEIEKRRSLSSAVSFIAIKLGQTLVASNKQRKLWAAVTTKTATMLNRSATKRII